VYAVSVLAVSKYTSLGCPKKYDFHKLKFVYSEVKYFKSVIEIKLLRKLAILPTYSKKRKNIAQ